MKAELHDLRMLKLAELYEIAYERFLAEVSERLVRDDAVRARLRALLGADHHARIVAHMSRLNARLSEADRADVERAALLDVLDVERAARDFYRGQADHVHDAGVASLFRDLAREEEAHVRVAEALVHAANPRGGVLEGTAIPVKGLRIAGDLAVLRGGSDPT